MSIRPHPTHAGWYYCDVYIGGKRERIRCYSYEEAVEYESRCGSSANISTKVIHPALEMIVDDYLQWVKENQRPATHEKRVQCFRRILPTFGKFRIKDFTQLSIDRYISGRSKHTAHDDLTSIKALAAWMKRRNLADEFPIQIEFTRPESKVKPAPNPKDIMLLINTCKKESIKVMLQLMIYTGLRWKEVRLLRWEDYRNGEIRIASPKTTEALIGIPGIMQKWFEDNKQMEGWIFVSYQGQPYYKLGNFFRAFKKETGIALSAHLLRHAGAIYLEEKTNGNVYAVNQFLRHASLGTTATYLRKYSANKLRESSDSIIDYMVNIDSDDQAKKTGT